MVIAIHVLFVFELGLRMVGADSLSSFFAKGSDKFDFLIILITALALFGQAVLGISRQQVKSVASISAFRFMRVMAIVPTIQHLLFMTLASIGNIVNLLIFTLVFLAVFAMQAVFIFCPRSNGTCLKSGYFSTFWSAMRTLYLIFTGEALNAEMEETMNLGETDPTQYDPAYVRGLAPCFFVIFFFLSQAVVINLYIAVIIENFKVLNPQP